MRCCCTSSSTEFWPLTLDLVNLFGFLRGKRTTSAAINNRKLKKTRCGNVISKSSRESIIALNTSSLLLHNLVCLWFVRANLVTLTLAGKKKRPTTLWFASSSTMNLTNGIESSLLLCVPSTQFVRKRENSNKITLEDGMDIL